MRRLLYHTHEQQTRETDEIAGIVMTGRCEMCEMHSKGKERRFEVLKSTKTRRDMPLERLFVDLAVPKRHDSVGGKHYAVLFVEDYRHIKLIRLLKEKNSNTRRKSCRTLLLKLLHWKVCNWSSLHR